MEFNVKETTKLYSQVQEDIYILNAIDNTEIDIEEDILVVKRRFFTKARNKAIYEFSNTWHVSLDKL